MNETEVDLRAHVAFLLRHGRWIAVVTLTAALAAGILTHLLPRTYEARALLGITTSSTTHTVTDPALSPTDGPAQLTIATTGPGLGSFAVSDLILERAIAALDPALQSGMGGAAALRPRLSLSPGADSSSVTLAVLDECPECAAAVANAWADAFVATINEKSEANELPNLFARQVAQLDLLAELEAEKQPLRWALEDARALRDRLSGQAAASPGLPEDDLLLWAMSARGAGADGISVSLSGAVPSTVGDQMRMLDRVTASLEGRSATLESRAESLRDELQATQARIVEAQSAILAPSLSTAQVIEHAGVPGTPVQAPKLALNVGVAAALAFLFGVFALLALEWWRAPRPGPAAQ